jgi:hypothetical protein
MEGSCARRVGDTAPSPPSAELPRRGSGIARPASHRGSERRRLIHRSRPPPCGGQIREADQGVGLGLGDAKVRAVTESATDPSVAFGDSSPQGGERRSSGDAADAKINAAPNHTSPVTLPHSPISIFHSPPATQNANAPATRRAVARAPLVALLVPLDRIVPDPMPTFRSCAHR